VFQNNSLINPSLRDANGFTNLQRMRRGHAPYGPDGQRIELHHINQTMHGPLMEMTMSNHVRHTRALHPHNHGGSQIDRPEFRTWRENYWRNRANDFM